MDSGHEDSGLQRFALGALVGFAGAALVLIERLGPALAALPAIDEGRMAGASTGWPHLIGHSGPSPD